MLVATCYKLDSLVEIVALIHNHAEWQLNSIKHQNKVVKV